MTEKGLEELDKIIKKYYEKIICMHARKGVVMSDCIYQENEGSGSKSLKDVFGQESHVTWRIPNANG
jgi:hypothetical protein